MERLLQLFIFIPLVAFFLSLVIHRSREFTLSAISYFAIGLNLLLLTLFGINWVALGAPLLGGKELHVYSSSEYTFSLGLFLDKIGMVYLWVGAFLSFLVTIYSRYYLHRERGYKRYFNTVLLFYTGFNITILSGNFETFFLGWEFLGISSFLLIGFYRERFLPVKNAMKVYSIYRIGDLGIILVIWVSLYLWNENITFIRLQQHDLVHDRLLQHSLAGVVLSLMILVSAAAKSALFPFSSWLPRAMEGPTPSTAIFYGSLSVNMGVFLLLRTYPYWEFQYSARVVIALVGVVTAVVSGLIARVQFSVKSQIAYASSAQLGIIFVEVAAGFHDLALFHFAGNAFFRTYQLLVSPSIVSYHIREQYYVEVTRRKSFERLLPRRLRSSLYVLSMKEWNLDWLLFRYIWEPLKRAGRISKRIPLAYFLFVFVALVSGGLLFYDHQQFITPMVRSFLPEIIATLGLMAVLRAFAERTNVYEGWGMIIVNNFLVALAVSFNERFDLSHVFMYLSGVVVAGIGGYFVLGYLDWKEKGIDLKQHYGHAYHYPVLSTLFLICCLVISGFPISPTFIGEDLIFSHIAFHEAALAAIVSLGFIIDGLALMRIYSRIFLGMPIKRFHEVGYRSS